MTMRLLLVEDDENKRSQILALLSDPSLPAIETIVAASLMSGVRLAKEKAPEIVLLDMTLPNYDITDGETGSGTHSFGGVEFLKQMRRLKIRTSVVVVTQFETFGQPPDVMDLADLDKKLGSEFSPMYKGAIYYHSAQEQWTHDLLETVKEIATLGSMK